MSLSCSAAKIFTVLSQGLIYWEGGGAEGAHPNLDS